MLPPRGSDVVALVLVESPALVPAVRRRLEQFAQAVRPLVAVDATLTARPGATVLLASVGRPGSHGLEGLAAWGRRPQITDVAGLLAAGDDLLLRLPTPSLVAAVDGPRGRLATSTGPLQTAYAASGEGVRVWSSHASAASVLSSGRLEVDTTRLGELIACDFIGGDGTMLRGVRALPPGTCVDVDGRDARERVLRTAAERWAPVDPRVARAAAPDELLAHLQTSDGGDRTMVGLTAGLDSLTVAVALADAGAPVIGMTFSQWDGAADMDGARRVARALGVQHLACDIRFWVDADGGMAKLHAAALLEDGVRAVGYGDVAWPPMDRWVVGMGAEIGRAFYWSWLAPRTSTDPRRGTLVQVLRSIFEPRLVGAHPELLRVLRPRWRAWIEDALATGHRGFAALDVVYGEQRVRRWGRAQMPRNGAEPVPAFAAPGLARLLPSLSIEDRLTSAWQRDFIAARRPDLLPAVAPARSRRLELPRRLAVTSMRRGRRRLGAPRPRAADVPWHADPMWDPRRAYISWLADDVLGGPLVREALGARWADEHRARMAAGDPISSTLAQLAGGAVALCAVDRKLRTAPPA